MLISRLKNIKYRNFHNSAIFFITFWCIERCYLPAPVDMEITANYHYYFHLVSLSELTRFIDKANGQQKKPNKQNVKRKIYMLEWITFNDLFPVYIQNRIVKTKPYGCIRRLVCCSKSTRSLLCRFFFICEYKNRITK